MPPFKHPRVRSNAGMKAPFIRCAGRGSRRSVSSGTSPRRLRPASPPTPATVTAGWRSAPDQAWFGAVGRNRATDVIRRMGNRIGANCEYAPVNRNSTIAGIMSADWRGVRSAATNSAR